jgi:hypothetical protein
MANSGILVVGVIVVVLIVVGAAFVLMGGNKSSSVSSTISYTNTTTYTSTVTSSSQEQTPVVMTDPPQVPAGTSALVMSYSNVMVHSHNATASSWTMAQGSGSVDLVALNNLTKAQVMATASTTANTSVDKVSYTLTSAQITVNGTTYNVAMPSNSTVTARTSGSTNVNSSSTVIINIAPTVTASKNTTTNAIVYAWGNNNATAVVYSNSTFSAQADANVGTSISLNAEILAELSSVLGITLGAVI